MERVRRVQRPPISGGDEVEIEGLGHDRRAGDGVGEDHGFDLGAEFGGGGGDEGVGVVEGGDGCEHEVCAFCCADEGFGGVRGGAGDG